jgi:lysozyme family protein
MDNFDKYIDKVLKHEGGYSNDPTDRGGETKYGISKRAYPSLDIKSLTKDRAKEIYKRDYWDKNKCHLLPEGVDYVHFDTAINMGGGRASKLLQEAAGVKVDGIVGPMTIAAAQEINPERYLLLRLNYYCQIVRKRNSQAKYIGGWSNRIMDILKTLEL